jgi:hypothetical protein
LQRQGLQTVFAHGAHLDQFVPVAQHPHYFATLQGWSMQTGKLIMKH